MNKTFSIIVPIYNAEKYVRMTIESILNQDYENFEVILVDDGSSDNSLSICNEYKHDCRVLVIAQENGGVSAARNAGLSAASGLYVLFCDSDDTLSPDALSVLWKMIENGFPDLISFGMSNTNGYVYSPKGHIQNVIEGKSYINDIILPEQLGIVPKTEKDIFPFSCNKVYKNRVIQKYNLRFNEKYRVWEDKDFVLLFLNYAETISFTEEPLYHYLSQNETSLSRTYSPELLFQVPEMFLARKAIFSDRYDFEGAYISTSFLKTLVSISKSVLKKEGHSNELIQHAFSNTAVIEWAKNSSVDSEIEKEFIKKIIEGDMESIEDYIAILYEQPKESLFKARIKNVLHRMKTCLQ